MKYKETKDYLLINDKMQNMFDYIEKESVEAIITDPPYELGFMGKSWDSSGVAFQIDTWQKCYDALKPGGYLLAFGGSRTYHRICCAIEDAGFEIRDCIMWLYGSGFPKSMNLAKSIEAKLTTGSGNKKDFYKCRGVLEESKSKGYTSMKQTNVEQEFRNTNYISKGYLKLDATTELAKEYQGWGTCLKPAYEPIIVARKPFKGSLVDNVIENGVGGLNIDECRIGNTSADNYDLEKRQVSKATGIDDSRFPANVILTYDETDKDEVCGGMQENENDCSRYFYNAKVSKKDRDEGLENFKNTHPTVKPVELMQYLVRLVAPKGSTVMDCFMGSGSTGKAVMFENRERDANYKFIGIEMTDEYLPICESRIEYALNKYEYDAEQETIKDHKEGRLNIFDFIGE